MSASPTPLPPAANRSAATDPALITPRPPSPWGPVLASVVTALILALALLSSIATIALLYPDVEIPLPPVVGAVGMLAMQTVAVLLTLLVASWRVGNPLAVLALAKPPTWSEIGLAVGGLVVVLVPLNAILYAVAGQAMIDDLLPFQASIMSPAAPLMALVLAVGAPLSEELLFRGFLQGALARSSLGFWGAALITTTAWTALHAGYSWIGIAEVFCIGLYFAWLLQRTGNLWLPIICHGLYNGLLFVVLRLVPLS
jgi:uncharacterized protein